MKSIERNYPLFSILMLVSVIGFSQTKRARDYGIEIGVFETGSFNAITDVKGVSVGHTTLIEGDDIRTGITAIIPHPGNIYQDKLPAAVYIGNGFGKMTGYSQVEELGNIETPVVLTNTLSVPVASNALISYTLEQNGNEGVRSVNPIVGETNDAYLNDIRGDTSKKNIFFKQLPMQKQGPYQRVTWELGRVQCALVIKGESVRHQEKFKIFRRIYRRCSCTNKFWRRLRN